MNEYLNLKDDPRDQLILTLKASAKLMRRYQCFSSDAVESPQVVVSALHTPHPHTYDPLIPLVNTQDPVLDSRALHRHLEHLYIPIASSFDALNDLIVLAPRIKRFEVVVFSLLVPCESAELFCSR